MTKVVELRDLDELTTDYLRWDKFKYCIIYYQFILISREQLKLS